MTDDAKVYVVLVNWNGWSDTIECLESLLRSSYSHYQVVVCDNASQDGSTDRIERWAAGELQADASDAALRTLTHPPMPKPVSIVRYDQATAEAGGDERGSTARVILVQAGHNLGFAGGNNIALRYALARRDFQYIWLLNNDTVVVPDALSHLVARLQERPDAGMCGSTLRYYNKPDTTQVLGGVSYNRWFATINALGNGRDAQDPIDESAIERHMAYVAGASMLIRRSLVEDVGLLSEDYFLYFEELDWATRARTRYALAFAAPSIVYHKEGRSIGSGASSGGFHRADYFGHRNRLRYTWRYFPIALPTVMLRTLLAVGSRVCRGQLGRAWRILRLLFLPSTYRQPSSTWRRVP